MAAAVRQTGGRLLALRDFECNTACPWAALWALGACLTYPPLLDFFSRSRCALGGWDCPAPSWPAWGSAVHNLRGTGRLRVTVGSNNGQNRVRG